MMKAVASLLLLTSACVADTLGNRNHPPRFEGHLPQQAKVKNGHNPNAPNYIFFVPDELRADVLGCYGGDAKTPNFDRLAQSGVRFEKPFVSNPVCAQSRAAFMTGWPTHVAGHRTLNSLLHNDEPNMLKYFKTNGYEVKWWGKNDVLATDAFEASVHSASSPKGAAHNSEQIGSKYSMLYKSFQDEKETPDNKAVEEAISYIKQWGPGKRPFVLFLPLTMPHPPYSAPEKFQNMYSNKTFSLASAKNTHKPEFHELIRKYHKFNTMSESEYSSMLQSVRQTYLAMVSYTDSLLGKLLDAVDAHPAVKERTGILAFSDHGDYAGDYGLVEKWPSGMEDALTQVPLIARIPEVTDYNVGSVYKEPVQLFDIMPTVMEVSGIQVPHIHFAKSLVKPMMGTADQNSTRKYVFAEGGFASYEPRGLESDCDELHQPCAPLGSNYYPKLLQQQERPDSVARAIMVRSNTHKLIWRNDPEYGEKDCELYDLVQDPKELVNKWDDLNYADVKMQLKDQLMHWLAQTSDITALFKDPRDSYPGVIQSPAYVHKIMTERR